AVETVFETSPGARLNVARRWSLFIVLCIGASMLTPSGWHGLWYPIQVMRMETLGWITEWQSPNFLTGNPLELWLLLLFGLALAGRLRLPWVRLVLLLGLTHLALRHARNIALVCFVSPLLIAAPLARCWYAAPRLGADVVRLDRWFHALAGPSSRRGWLLVALCAGVALAMAQHATIEP